MKIVHLVLASGRVLVAYDGYPMITRGRHEVVLPS